jgi:AcrR family transcriptional regulator
MKSGSRQPTVGRPYRMVARAQAAEQTGKRIVDAAEELFGELLYDQVSLKAVANRAGVTMQTVIRRFGSKEGLFVEWAVRRSQELRRWRDGAAPGGLSEIIRNLMESYEKWGRHQLNLLAQEQRTETIAVAVRSGRAYHHRWVKRVFAAWLDALAADERDVRTAQLTAVTDVYMWKVLRDDLGLDDRQAELAIGDLVERLLG